MNSLHNIFSGSEIQIYKSMEYQEYLKENKEIYNDLLLFIEHESGDNSYNYKNLIKNLQNQKILNNPERVTLFLHLLVQISNDHHRLPEFFSKIEKILLFFFKLYQIDLHKY